MGYGVTNCSSTRAAPQLPGRAYLYSGVHFYKEGLHDEKCSNEVVRSARIASQSR
jgi:hypothetical protein